MDEESFQRRLQAAINKKKKEQKIINQDNKLKKLSKQNAEAYEILKARKENKRAKKLMKKKRERLGDKGQKSSMNYEVGDQRFAENYKCDYKLKLHDKEKELAAKMSEAQFRDDEEEGQAENERDMGSNDGIIEGL